MSKTVYQVIEWRPVKGLERFVEISNCGQLRSVVRPHPRGGVRGGRLLKLNSNVHGYMFARVSHGTEKTNVYVHKAAAIAFLSNTLGLPQVNHKDGVKTNNHTINLEWCTASENSQHKFSIIGHKALNKLAVVGFRDTEERFFDSLTSAHAAGFNLCNISAVIHGRRRTCGGYQWRIA